MRAAPGDRMVVASGSIDGPVRDGEVVEVRSTGGAPPYLVRWSDSGTETLFFPGPDAHVEPAVTTPEGGGPAASESVRSGRLKTWRVDVTVYESGAGTSASAVLHSEQPDAWEEHGEAHLNPRDEDVPAIGDEVAVARALRRLADRLIGAAEAEIAAKEGHEVHLRP